MTEDNSDNHDNPDDLRQPEVRRALDAGDIKALQRNPSDENAKLEVELDESFPGSDAPSSTQPGKGSEPAPSSGYDPEEEARLAGEH